MHHNRNGWLCVADPNWLDFLSLHGNLDSLIYYKGPYRPTKNLPLNAPFICCRRGETPRRIHLVASFNGFEVINKENAWARFGQRLGIANFKDWSDLSVGADNLISCHKLIDFKFIDEPPLLQDSGVPLNDAASSMGRYLSSSEAKQIVSFIKDSAITDFRQPEELKFTDGLWEGSYSQVLVNKYERNRRAREQCIAHYGAICATCGMMFRDDYGEIGNGFIHVHHLLKLSEIATEYQVNPINDLRPLCPNCHAMIHMRDPPYTVDEMKKIIANARRHKPQSAGKPIKHRHP